MAFQLLSVLLFLQLNVIPPPQPIALQSQPLAVADRSATYTGPDGGTITISIKNGILTGAYEYYDKWNEAYKDYTDINIVYFYGESSDGINYKLTTRWSASDKIVNGECHFMDNYKTLKIRLSEQPPGYASFDFTGNTKGNIFSLKKTMQIAGIRLIKPKKAALYNYTGGIFTKRKGYLLSEDVVLLLDGMNGYSKISYYSRSAGKSVVYWIKNEDMLEADPALWSK